MKMVSNPFALPSPPSIANPYRAMTENELAVDWIRLQNENWLLHLDMARERRSHLITLAVLLVQSMLLLLWL